MFAESAGKKGGEFYTPRDVVSLMVRLVDPKEGRRIYAPCCGSGGMVIYARQHVGEHGGNSDNLPVRSNESAGGEILLYQTEDGETRVEVRLREETVWLSQKQLAELL